MCLEASQQRAGYLVDRDQAKYRVFDYVMIEARTNWLFSVEYIPMANRKQTLPPSTNYSRTSDERPAKRAKVDDINQASTSSVEPLNGTEDSNGAIQLSEDEEGLEEEVGPVQSNNEPRASDLYLDTVRHSMIPTQQSLTRPLDQSSTPRL